MGIRSLSSASVATGAKRSKFWDQTTYPFENSWESIATYSSGATGTITFNSIPSTFKYLRLVTRLRDSRSPVAYSSANIYFNGITTGYAYTWIYSDSRAGVFEDSTSGTTSIATPVPGSGVSGANIYGYGILDIYDYANTTKFTGVQGIGGYVDPGGAYNGGEGAFDINGTWANTAVVNSISIGANIPNFASGVRASLYGMKG